MLVESHAETGDERRDKISDVRTSDVIDLAEDSSAENAFHAARAALTSLRSP